MNAKKILPQIIFFYCAVASFFITISTVSVATTILPIIFIVIFLPVTSYFIVEFFEHDFEIAFLPRKGELFAIFIVFIILFGIGLRNVLVSGNSNSSSPTNNNSPLIFTVTEPTATPAPQILTVKITDGSKSVNLRAKPTIYSNSIGSVKDGDKLTEISKSGEWYQVSVNGIEGYISNLYIQ